MKLEDQLVNRKLSENLRDLEVPQESLWYWGNHNGTDEQHFYLENGFICDREWKSSNWGYEYKHYSAFTVAELLNLLNKYKKVAMTVPTQGNAADHLAKELIYYEAYSNKN